MIASPSVLSTSTIDSRTTVVLSNATRHCNPGGNDFSIRDMTARTPASACRALACGSSVMPMPEASSPAKRRFAV
jgi:hypothetical protein